MKFAKYNLSALAMFLCLGFSMTAAAAVPATMTYHGELNDSAGQPVDTTVETTFRIFDAESAGTEAWTETFSTVDVNDGSFSVQLGASTPLTSVFDGNAYWLEVSINGETLSPRTPIESVPYALRANSAANADTLAGQTPADLIASASASTPDSAGDLSYDNSTSGLSATDIQAALDELAELRARVTTLETSTGVNAGKIATNTSALSTNTGKIATNTSALSTNTGKIATNTSAISTNTGKITTAETNITNLQTLTQDMARVSIHGKPAVTFTGVNVHVRDGSGSTSGAVNGLGNLIVGYDEGPEDKKTGAHNLVVGSGHYYLSSGGLVAGYQNAISAPYATITGGSNNAAGGPNGTASSVSGGYLNSAVGSRSSISGGFNRAVTGSQNWAAGSLFQNQ